MYVQMVGMMSMFMEMGSAVMMKMEVIVLFVTDHTVNSPYKVNKSECSEQIGNNTASHTFDKNKFR